MKITKRMLSIVCALALVFSAVAVLTTVSASAETDTTAYKFTSLRRNYDYGEWPQTIEYTSGGYVTYKDTGRFTRQRIANWVISNDTAAQTKFINTIETAIKDYDGILAMDVTVNDCWNSNYLEPSQGGFELNTFINYKYKDPDEVDTDINPSTGEPWNAEGWVYGKFGYQGYGVKLGDTVTEKLGVEDYTDIVENYSGFMITSVQMHIMGYADNPFNTADKLADEYKPFAGQAGVGNFDVQFSPYYILGTTPPEKGEDLGENVSFTPNAEDPTMGAGTFTIEGKDYPQQPLAEGAEKRSDGKYGNGKGIDWDNAVTVLYGDANDDGKVTVVDLLVVKKHSVGIKVAINLTNADVNFDGKCTVVDILMIKKHTVGIKLAPWDNV